MKVKTLRKNRKRTQQRLEVDQAIVAAMSGRRGLWLSAQQIGKACGLTAWVVGHAMRRLRLAGQVEWSINEVPSKWKSKDLLKVYRLTAPAAEPSGVMPAWLNPMPPRNPTPGRVIAGQAGVLQREKEVGE